MGNPIYCPTCGIGNRSGARFCNGCGKPLADAPGDAPVAAPQQSQTLPANVPPPHRTGVLVAGLSGVGAISILGLVLGLALLADEANSTLGLGGAPIPDATTVEDRPVADASIALDAPAEPAAQSPTPQSSVADVSTGSAGSPGGNERGAPEAPNQSSPTPTATRVSLRIPGTDLELPRLSDAEEASIGAQIATQVEDEYGLDRDPVALDRVRRIGRRIVPYSDRPSLDYHFAVLATDEVNALAVPGGFIYVTRGMYEFVRSEEELGAVIGHELAHVGRRHGAQQIEAVALVEVGKSILFKRNPELEDVYQSREGQIATAVTTMLAGSGWSRQQEFEADEHGTLYMSRAGYPARAMVQLFERMQHDFEPDRPGAAERLLRTHPPFDERIARVESTIALHQLD